MKPTLLRTKQNPANSSTSPSSRIWLNGKGRPPETISIKKITKKDLIRQRNMPPPEDVIDAELVAAPLEVIYEAYAREEEDEGEYAEEKRKEAFGVIERYASLSMCYSKTDTDTDSPYDGDSTVIEKWDSPENVFFPWDDNED
ncbi:hypothetical protein BC332_00118 [Capsicum chinense]|nr:hypothetical protein BC332_00118 [Capsicum chinense]